MITRASDNQQFQPDSLSQRTNRAPQHPLPGQQRRVFEIIVNYFRFTQEACPATYIGRRMGLHHSTVQDHIAALYRKGLLMGPNAPAVPVMDEPRGTADSAGS